MNRDLEEISQSSTSSSVKLFPASRKTKRGRGLHHPVRPFKKPECGTGIAKQILEC